MDRLVAMLAPDAVLVGDGGGKARSIGVPMVGAAQVGRALATFYRMGEDWGVTLRPAVVNGGPGFRSFDARGPAGQRRRLRDPGRRRSPACTRC